MPYDDMMGMGHRLELVGRATLVVTGVEEVERFDEEEIIMRTTAGTLVVGGTEKYREISAFFLGFERNKKFSKNLKKVMKNS